MKHDILNYKYTFTSYIPKTRNVPCHLLQNCEGTMSRVKQLVSAVPILKTGIGGNYYVFCESKEPLIAVCSAIEKSANSIYYHEKHHCYVFRSRSKFHKNRLNNFFNK